ncbi:mitochondrion organization and biogenesis protein [Colletotrichum scovillei]|nr:mitochondrion organization and biogenesis protein [Colletotrichum scovillei]
MCLELQGRDGRSRRGRTFRTGRTKGYHLHAQTRNERSCKAKTTSSRSL